MSPEIDAIPAEPRDSEKLCIMLNTWADFIAAKRAYRALLDEMGPVVAGWSITPEQLRKFNHAAHRLAQICIDWVPQ